MYSAENETLLTFLQAYSSTAKTTRNKSANVFNNIDTLDNGMLPSLSNGTILKCVL